MFRKLFMKELKGTVFLPTLVAAVLTIAFDIFLRTRSGVWPAQAILALGILPAIIPFIWPLVMGILTFHFEWNTNSVYLLLSLPVKGRTVIAAKVAALLTGVIGLFLVNLGSYFLFLLPLAGDIFHFFTQLDFWRILLIGGVQLLAGMLFLIITAQFAYLTSRLVSRFKGLILVVILIGSYWISAKLGQWLHPVYSWIPKFTFPIQMANPINKAIQGTLDLDLGLLTVILLITAGFFALNSWLFARRVEL